MCDASSKRARRSRGALGTLAHPSEVLQVPGSTSKVTSAPRKRQQAKGQGGRAGKANDPRPEI